MKTKLGLLLISAIVLVLPSSAQVAYSTSTKNDGNGHMTATISVGGTPFSLRAVTSAPYYAEESTEHTQTLADGTHIVRKQQIRKHWRDSEGRTRVERPAIPGDPSGPMIVEIADPVAGCRYLLDSQNHIAHRMLLQTPPTLPKEGPSPATIVVKTLSQTQAQNQPVSETEELGTQSIEGVEATGERTTRTIPIGFDGNDKPIVVVTEWWLSYDLHLTVLRRNSDPRSGEQITRLTNISRDEPAPGLFQPPPGYSVVDEKGEFTMTMVYNQ